MSWKILEGDWIERLRELPDASVHCVVTSPPYWGLRDYGVPGQLGLEKTPEEYIAKVVAGFREVWRVLRNEGALWLNMGDCYSNDTKWGGQSGNKNSTSADGGYQGQRTRRGKDCDPKRGPAAPGQPMQQNSSGLKPKDLVGLPWMLAFALRADGWYLRAQCPWIKRNSMPESVMDRPGTSTETIFLFSKSQRYFYDAEAVKMPCAGTAHDRGSGVNPKALLQNQHARIGKERDPRHQECAARNGKEETRATRVALHNNSRKQRASADHMRHPDALINGIRPKMPGKNSRIYQDRDPQHSTARKSRQNESFSAAVASLVLTRGRRNHDWFMDSWQGLLTDDDGAPMVFVVNPSPFKQAHFATFPPKLVEPCILAGTSEKGCCPKCGAPWKRIVEPDAARAEVLGNGYHDHDHDHDHGQSNSKAAPGGYITTGWQPTCHCNAGEPVACTVLDPFSGAGTTGLVATRFHRDFIGIELKPEYAAMGRQRIVADAPLFNEERQTT